MADEIRNALTAGRLTMFSEGDYSDYSRKGTYVALKDLTLGRLRAIGDALGRDALKRGERHFNAINSIEAHLIREGYLLEVDVTEVHLGSYRTFNPTIE